jgi:hypothetical protein
VAALESELSLRNEVETQEEDDDENESAESSEAS